MHILDALKEHPTSDLMTRAVGEIQFLRMSNDTLRRVNADLFKHRDKIDWLEDSVSKLEVLVATKKGIKAKEWDCEKMSFEEFVDKQIKKEESNAK